MRKVTRRPLSAAALDALATLQAEVDAAASPRDAAIGRWKRKRKVPFREVRTVLVAMANGRQRCMYCEDSAGTDIEHFWPKSDYPDRAFVWDNYLLSCSGCNSSKQHRFPLLSGQPALIDPSDPQDDPANHLAIDPATGTFRALGPKGEFSIAIFGLNRRILAEGRCHALRQLQLLLLLYQRYIRDDDHENARRTREAIESGSFPLILTYLIHLAETPDAPGTLLPGVAEIVRNHDVASWLTERAA